jgi:hypothetical protein
MRIPDAATPENWEFTVFSNQKHVRMVFGACQKWNDPVRNTVYWHFNLHLRFCSKETPLQTANLT